MLTRKTLSVEGITAQTQFDLSKVDDTPFGNHLKLPLPKDGSFRYELLFLPSDNGKTIMKPVIEVAINHVSSGKFIARYFLTNPADLDSDPCQKEKWAIYNRAGRVSTDAFRAIRIASGDRSKFICNVFTLTHPKAEDQHSVKLWVYGAKVKEAIDELVAGQSDKWDYTERGNPLDNIFIIPVKAGMLPSAMYEGARFRADDKGVIKDVYAKLDESDLYSINSIVDGTTDCGHHVNPSKERVMELLERGGYLVNGVAPTNYEVQADGGSDYKPPAPPAGNEYMDNDSGVVTQFDN